MGLVAWVMGVRGKDAGSVRIEMKYGRDRGLRIAPSSTIQAS
jgi:hypothetical protein